MPSKTFHIRISLLILLVVGLLAVSVTMVLTKAPLKVTSISGSSITTTASGAPPGNYVANDLTRQTVPATPGQWVVIDCAQRKVVHCPHAMDMQGQTPSYPVVGSAVYHGACRDVSIHIESFCL
jgi:hypothetical protein